MDNLNTIVNIVFPVLVVIIGGACILQFSIMSTLRASNTDLRDLTKDQAGKIERLEQRVADLMAEREALRKVVTGEVQLATITDLIQHHHEDTIKRWERTDILVERADESLTELVAATREAQRRRRPRAASESQEGRS